MAFHKNLTKVRFAAVIIAILLLIRWIVIFVATLLFNAAGVKNILVDSIAIAVYVSLIILGTRVKDKDQQAAA